MRSFTPPGAPGRCPRCLLLVAHCLCASIGTPEPSDPAVLIVRHHWEAWKSTGTARLAALALSNLRIIDMKAEEPEPVRAELATLEGAWVLYPGKESSARLQGRPKTLIVIDGTWRQTRKMLRRLPELSHLPHFALEEDPHTLERDRLRQPPRPGARSTLESIADALRLLDSPERGQRLLDLHSQFVEQTRISRGQNPSVT
jgi:DTW domain-containing protein YfiP